MKKKAKVSFFLKKEKRRKERERDRDFLRERQEETDERKKSEREKIKKSNRKREKGIKRKREIDEQKSEYDRRHSIYYNLCTRPFTRGGNDNSARLIKEVEENQ